MTDGGERARALVVEDDLDIADLISVVVEDLGFDVWLAHDGASAVRAFEAFQPQVAVIDLGLPDMTGYELLARLRLAKHRGCRRLIAMSASGDAADSARAVKAGFEALVYKPHVRTVLEKLLRRRPS